MQKQHFLRPKPFFVLLLPVFFVLHGYTENYSAIPLNDALLILLLYLLVAVALTATCWLLFKNLLKAAFVASCFLAFNFFFGSVHDYIRSVAPGSFVSRYSILLPISAVVLLLIAFSLKRSGKSFRKIGLFLNVLFLIFILVDLGILISKASNQNPLQITGPQLKSGCDTCLKNDIYLIVADEYAGKSQLQEVFNYDNSLFENELRKRGFHVIENSIANYNQTAYTMAALFQMDYLRSLQKNIVNHRDLYNCRLIIKASPVVEYLEDNGYDIYNYSFFDISNKQRVIQNPFLPSQITLLTSQTFTRRFMRDLWFNFASDKKIGNVLFQHLENNNKLEKLTRDIVLQNTGRPKFVYTHLGIPHFPYYYDSIGRITAEENITDDYKFNQQAYVEYLVYSNKKLLALIDHIKLNSEKPPLIILLSDHGFRQFGDSSLNRTQFSNMNAVHLPGGDSTQFFPGISTVNLFRAIINERFDGNLPMLKDSTSFIWE